MLAEVLHPKDRSVPIMAEIIAGHLCRASAEEALRTVLLTSIDLTRDSGSAADLAHFLHHLRLELFTALHAADHPTIADNAARAIELLDLHCWGRGRSR